MRISDWSSDVCSSDLRAAQARRRFMAKREQAKHKIDRRLGVNLWGRPKSPLNNREYGPGQHGQRRRKPPAYGIQLMAKQKLKGYYGNIGAKQFRTYYAQEIPPPAATGQPLHATPASPPPPRESR